MQNIFQIGLREGILVFFDDSDESTLNIKQLNAKGYKIVAILEMQEMKYAVCDYNSSNKELGTNGL